MTPRSPRLDRPTFWCIALVALAVYQPVPAQDQNTVEQQIQTILDSPTIDVDALIRMQRKAAWQQVIADNTPAAQQQKARAAEQTRKAAEQGKAAAQHNLGVMYYQGEGLPQDYAKAMKWFRKAAEQGNAPAQFMLGLMYGGGEGVSEDYVQAYAWMILAATRAGSVKEIATERKNLLRRIMTRKQVSEAQELAGDP